MKTIRIRARNNADARRCESWRRALPSGVTVRHNGGKTVVLTCADRSTDAVLEVLDTMHEIADYEVAP